MLRSWAMQRSARFTFGVIVSSCGLFGARLLMPQSSFAFATAVFAIGLAALVGAGKQASP
jgi:hypothetical protein